MKFDINNYEGKYVMHCKTDEEAKDFCNYLHEHGRTWRTGQSYKEKTQWGNYQQNTVYYFNTGTFGSLHCAKDYKYRILEWSDFMNNKFTKANLKTGDVIQRRNGKVEIVNLELGMLILKAGWNNLDEITEDLTDKNGEEYDIVAVRRPIVKGDCQFDAFTYKWGYLVYERTEPIEMTLAEVCKLLGKEIKIVK